MMFFEGNIAAPPTMTVFSPDISLFIILSCALAGATTAAVRASAAKAAADKNAMRFDMDWSPDGLSDRRTSAGDEGNNDAGFVGGQTASPLRRVTGGLVGGFQGINFRGVETFWGSGRVLPMRVILRSGLLAASRRMRAAAVVLLRGSQALAPQDDDAGTTYEERSLIPTVRRLHETSVPGRADQDLVHADPRRHAGDEGDGAADIFRLQHPGLLFFRRHHRPQLQDRGCDLAGRQATCPQTVDAFIHVKRMGQCQHRMLGGGVGRARHLRDTAAGPGRDINDAAVLL